MLNYEIQQWSGNQWKGLGCFHHHHDAAKVLKRLKEVLNSDFRIIDITGR